MVFLLFNRKYKLIDNVISRAVLFFIFIAEIMRDLTPQLSLNLENNFPGQTFSQGCNA